MRNYNIKIWGLIFVFLCGLCSCSEKDKRRVLVVHSYDERYAAYPDFNRLIEDRFEKERVDVDIRTVYLDCENYDAKAELRLMNNLLDSVSEAWKPEVIIVNEDQASYSLMKCNHPLVKEVPIVFGGVNYPNWELIDKYPNITGNHDKIAFVENINMAKVIFGQKIDLFTILDSTYLDKQIVKDAREQVRNHKITGFMDASYVFTNVCTNSFKNKGYTVFTSIPVRNPQKKGQGNLMWALNQYYRNQCYIQLKRDFTTINLSNICSSPSLTMINEAFNGDEKLLGGYITTLSIQAEEEVEKAVRILNGIHPSDIPIVESRKEHVVDWNVMQKLGMSKDKILPEYHIINIPLRAKYPVMWTISVGTITILLLTVFVCLIWLYLREQKRKKRALYALANEKETLSLAIAGGTTYVWRLENDFFIFENAFWDSLGMQAQNLAFDGLLKYVHPEHWSEVKHNWKDLYNTRKKITQLRCDFNGKGYQWWEFRYTTNPLSEGGYKTAGLILNVQEFKNREAELEAARLLAEKAELKQSFLANMSHEIRTPLNSIVGFSNILAIDEELEVEERLEYIDTINKNSELLLKLVNDILELSRMESGYMSFHYEKCLVNKLIDDVYMTHQVLITPRLEFLKEEEDVRLEINVDKDRLTQVLTNFLNNASKFTEKGYIKLGCNYLPAEGQVCIYVEDTGRGIPREEQKMIFSRFYKQNEFSQGAGLGLSICQVIIEKLNGQIGLYSELGKGSRFSVNLPCVVIN